MFPQAYISPTTSIGANLVAESGATFRCGPRLPTAVCFNGTFGGGPKELARPTTCCLQTIELQPVELRALE
jgi:hypothetical protein